MGWECTWVSWMESPPFFSLSGHCNFRLPLKLPRISENRHTAVKGPPAPSCVRPHYIWQGLQIMALPWCCWTCGMFLLRRLASHAWFSLGGLGEELPRLPRRRSCQGGLINCLPQPIRFIRSREVCMLVWLDLPCIDSPSFGNPAFMYK